MLTVAQIAYLQCSYGNWCFQFGKAVATFGIAVARLGIAVATKIFSLLIRYPDTVGLNREQNRVNDCADTMSAKSLTTVTLCRRIVNDYANTVSA